MSTETKFDLKGFTVTHEGNGVIKVLVNTEGDSDIEQLWALKDQYNRPSFADNLAWVSESSTLEHVQELMLSVATLEKGPTLLEDAEGKSAEDLLAFDSVYVNGDFQIITTIRRVDGTVLNNIWKLDPSYCNEAFTRHIPTLFMNGPIEAGLSFLSDCTMLLEGPVIGEVVGNENFLADIAKRMFGFLKPSGKGKGFKYPTDEEIKRAGSAYKALEDKAKQTILNDSWLEKNIAGTEVTVKMPFGTVDEFVSAVQRATSDVTKFAALSSTTQSAIESLCSRVDAEAKKFFDKNGVDYTTDNSLTNFIEKEVKKFNTSKTVCDFYKPKWQDALGNVFVYTAPKDKKGGLVDGSISQTVNAESKTYKDVTLTLTAEDVKKLATALLALDKAFVVKDELYVGEHFDNYDYLSGEYYDSQSYAIDMLWDAVFDQYWWEFVEPVIESTLEVDKLLIDVIGKSVK